MYLSGDGSRKVKRLPSAGVMHGSGDGVRFQRDCSLGSECVDCCIGGVGSRGPPQGPSMAALPLTPLLAHLNWAHGEAEEQSNALGGVQHNEGVLQHDMLVSKQDNSSDPGEAHDSAK